MSQLVETKIPKEAEVWMEDMCNELFREWSADLTIQEKEVWLWNALVELLKIKKRRGSLQS